MSNFTNEGNDAGTERGHPETDGGEVEERLTDHEAAWSEDGDVEAGAAVSEELVRYEGPGEDLEVWKEPEGAAAPETPGDAEAPDPEAFDPPTAEEVRAEVLADVEEYFETADLDDDFAPRPDEEFIEESWFDFGYLDSRTEVARKWVNEPYAYVSILYDDEAKEYRYHVTEPVLDGFEEYVRADLTKILRDSLLYQDIEEEENRKSLFRTEAKGIINDHARSVAGGSLYKLLYYLTRDFVDYGKIDPMMRDGDIEDISCDGVDIPVFVYHREFRDLGTNVAFERSALDSFTVRLAQKSGKSISVSNPLVDASLPDGSRIQLTLGGEVSTRGSNFTIRKFADVPYTPVDLINWNTFSVDEMAYFWLTIENNKSLIFAGGTGSGKTTSLNAVSFFIPPNSKVVSIEDTREVTLPHDNWIQSVTRSGISEGGRGEVGMYQLLQSALRQRPEYILVGEIRTEARVALTFFQAIGTGHTAYTTIHADSIEGVMARLQNEPLSIPAQMIKNLDVVSIQRQIRLEDKRVRRNQMLFEILPGGEGDEVLTRTVFKRNPKTDQHEAVAESHALAEIMEDRGWNEQRLAAELDLRREVLQYLVDNDINSYADVTGLIHTFHKDPEYVVEAMRAGELQAGDFAVDPGEEFPEETHGDVAAEELPAGDGDETEASEIPDAVIPDDDATGKELPDDEDADADLDDEEAESDLGDERPQADEADASSEPISAEDETDEDADAFENWESPDTGTTVQDESDVDDGDDQIPSEKEEEVDEDGNDPIASEEEEEEVDDETRPGATAPEEAPTDAVIGEEEEDVPDAATGNAGTEPSSVSANPGDSPPPSDRNEDDYDDWVDDGDEVTDGDDGSEGGPR